MRIHSLMSGAVFLGTLLLPQMAGALQGTGALAPGSYRCASYNVSGGGGSCHNMPRLVLNPDGSYQFSSTRGRWSIQHGKLVLSESRLWGAGEILGHDTIRFEYDYRSWRHVVTWICQACARAEADGAGSAAGRGSVAGGSDVGLSLTLEFDQAIGGVSGFVIVPAAHARGYTHNAPLPKGAVQGLVRETSATAVALATNKDNKLRSGRRYVVFLSWPRETIPVAILDVPPVNKDYSARLRATLDGAGVIRRLGATPEGARVTPAGTDPFQGKADALTNGLEGWRDHAQDVPAHLLRLAPADARPRHAGIALREQHAAKLGDRLTALLSL